MAFVIASFVVSPFVPAFAQSVDTDPATNSDVTAGTLPSTSTADTQGSVGTLMATPSDTDSASGTDTNTPVTPADIATPDTSAPSSGQTPLTSASSDNTPQTNTTASPITQGPTPQTLNSGGYPNPVPQPVAQDTFNEGLVKIDKNTGALNTIFPIGIPPGRNGLQPNVDLVYNSQDGKQGSIFGEGWSVNIPYIQRLNKTGADNLYSTSTPNYYTSSLDGELATTSVASNYVPRTENGAFNKYVFSTSSDQWTMTGKSGTQYLFGSTTDSQQSDPNNSAHVYKWMLRQVTDTNGNIVTYSYFKDSSQIYPSSTIYTNTSSTTGIFEVDFLRQSRSDIATSSEAGFGVSSKYLVNEIDAKVNGAWVRKYILGYGVGANGSTSLLTSIVESGRDSLGNVTTLPTSTFSYAAQTPGWTSSSTWNPPIAFADYTTNDNGARIADVSGDALTDLVSGYNNGTTYSSSSYANTAHGWTSTSTWYPPIAFANNTACDTGVRVADVNGDGLQDIIYGYTSGSPNYTFSAGAYINAGNGWVASSTWAPPITIANNSCLDLGVRIVDVNGDGLPDVIYSYTGPSPNYTFYSGAYINTGAGWVSNSAWAPPIAFTDSNGTDNGVRIADINGDGLPDFISGYNTEYPNYTFSSSAYLNTGNGWTSDDSWAPSTEFANRYQYDDGNRIADINGDGLPDIVGGFTDGTGTTTYWADINTGHGWVTSSTWNPPMTFSNNGYDNGARIVDVNGNGLPDVVYGYTGGSPSYTFSSGAYINNNSSRADLLAGVTYPQGGSSSITYASAATLTDNSGNIVNQVPYPVYVVTGTCATPSTRDSSNWAFPARYAWPS